MSFTEEELAEKCERCVGGFLPDEDGVQCDECNCWFHYECQGIQPEDQEKLAHEFSKFYCSTCNKDPCSKIVIDVPNVLPCALLQWPAIKRQLKDAMKICLYYSDFDADENNISEGQKCNRFTSRALQSLNLAHRIFKQEVQCASPVFKRDGSFLRTVAADTGIFEGLRTYFRRLATGMVEDDLTYAVNFIKYTLPCIIEYALMMEKECPLIPQHNVTPDTLEKKTAEVDAYTVRLPRKHVTIALASMFLCLTTTKKGINANYTTFFPLLHKKPVQAQLKMILNYFSLMATHRDEPAPGDLAYSRLVGTGIPLVVDEWRAKRTRLCELEILDKGSIEDQIGKAMEVDFANEKIGGGTLTGGRLQEEIRFFTAPELQVAMLFNEPMGRHDAIQVFGYQTYSRRTGYDSSLKYNGPAPPTKQADFDEDIGVYDTRLTAIDALPINSFSDQYTYPAILRELNKAFIGFHQLNFFGESKDGRTSNSKPEAPTKDSPLQTDMIHQYAESLALSLMADIRSELAQITGKCCELAGRSPEPPVPTSTDDGVCADYSNHPVDLPAVCESSTIADTSPAVADVCQSESPFCVEEYAEKVAGEVLKHSLTTLPEYPPRSSVLAPLKEEETPPSPTTLGITSQPRLGIAPPDLAISVDIEIENSNAGENVSVQLSAESHHDMQVSMGVFAERKLEVDIVADLRVLPPQCSVVNTTPPLSSKDLPKCSPESTTEETEAHKESGVESTTECSVTCSNSTARPQPRDSFTDGGCNTDSMNTNILTSSCSVAATPTSAASSTASSGDVNAARQIYSATSVNRDPVLSLDSQTDNIKERIDAYAQSLSEEIVRLAGKEISERRRLFIENNVTSTDLLAATAMSDKVLTHIISELRNEAANSIPDSEKLHKGAVVGCIANLSCDVITENDSDWSTQTYSRPIPSPSKLSPNSASRQPFYGRRQSAPSGARRHSLTPVPRRGSEPSVLFRTRSPNSNRKTPNPSDYIRNEFHRVATGPGDERCLRSKTVHSSSLGAASDPLWRQLRQHSGGRAIDKVKPDSKAALLAPDLSTGELNSQNHLDVSRSQSGDHQSQSEAESPAMNLANSGRLLRLNLSETGHDSEPTTPFSPLSELTPPFSPLQHQYLALFSEVTAENILHDSLRTLKRTFRQPKRSKLSNLNEEDETKLSSCGDGQERNVGFGPKPIATGNWGCGAFGGDPQLKSLLQWIAATESDCPKMIYYSSNNRRLADEQFGKVVDQVKNCTTGDLLNLIFQYVNRLYANETCGESLFEFILSLLE